MGISFEEFLSRFTLHSEMKYKVDCIEEEYDFNLPFISSYYIHQFHKDLTVIINTDKIISKDYYDCGAEITIRGVLKQSHMFYEKKFNIKHIFWRYKSNNIENIYKFFNYLLVTE